MHHFSPRVFSCFGWGNFLHHPCLGLDPLHSYGFTADASPYLFRFPFDKQNCSIELVFTDYEESEVAWKLFEGKTFESVPEISNPAWEIIEQNVVTTTAEVYNWKENDLSQGKLSKLIYTVTLKREPRTAIVYVICPTLAISTFNIISCVLPTGEGLLTSLNYFLQT